MLACLPDSAALSFLVDHAVSGTQPVQMHFAAMNSRKIYCTMGPIKLSDSHLHAKPPAFSPIRVHASVRPWLVGSEHKLQGTPGLLAVQGS